MRQFAQHDEARFLAVCDPFRDRRERAAAALGAIHRGGGVMACADYREVMQRKDIDAVVCCSCDHWHVPLAIAAARSGKDMYIEKPLGPSLAWAKTLRAEIARAGRVFQYGTQQRSSREFRHVVELVRNGHLGKISRVDAWCIDGTRAKDWFDPKSLVPEKTPENLSYDLWLGPAEKKPYSRYRVHREGSFHTYDYSIGFLGGWGAHPLDIAQWGLDADGTSPVAYEGTGMLPKACGLFSTVYNWDIRCRYESGVRLRFMSHRPAEPVVRSYRKRWSDHGTTFFGGRGWISVDRRGVEASDPELLSKSSGSSGNRVTKSDSHSRNFLDCVKSRNDTVSPFESAIRSDTISHMSDLVVRTGRKIRWDPVREELIEDEAANRLLKRTQRAPYVFDDEDDGETGYSS